MDEETPQSPAVAALPAPLTITQGIVPTDPTAAALMAGEMAARIQFLKEQLAEGMYQPMLPPRTWAGRDELMVRFVEHFGCSPEEAGAAVDATVAELWAIDRPDDKAVQTQLHRQRLRMLRALVLNAIQVGRVEKTYKFEPKKDAEGKEDPTTMLAIPFKEKRFTGVDMAQVRMLLEIEQVFAETYGGQSSSTNLFAQFFGELDKRIDDRKASSKAGEIRNKDFGDLGDAGAARVKAAILEMEAKGTRVVEAKVVESAATETEVGEVVRKPKGKKKRKGKS